MRTRKLLFCILATAIVCGVALFLFLLLPHWQEDLPVPWDLGELNEDMPLHWEAGPLNVLVWEVIDDGQRVYDRCLAVKRYDRPSDKGETCALGYPTGESRP